MQKFYVKMEDNLAPLVIGVYISSRHSSICLVLSIRTVNYLT
jgi:hypothetical protein